MSDTNKSSKRSRKGEPEEAKGQRAPRAVRERKTTKREKGSKVAGQVTATAQAVAPVVTDDPTITNPRLERMSAVAGIDLGLNWTELRREARRHNRQLARLHRQLPMDAVSIWQRQSHAQRNPVLHYTTDLTPSSSGSNRKPRAKAA